MKLFILSIGLLVLFGCGTKTVAYNGHEPADVTIYVVDHGWHAGIIVNAKSVAEVIAGLPFDAEDVNFIEFGWGDQAFYQAESFSLCLAIKALVFPTGSVMHVAGLRHSPEVYFRSSVVEQIPIAQTRLIAMLNHINRSFARNPQGGLISLGRGLYANSGFYAAKGDYHLFNNCNTWVMSALTRAGVKDSVPAAIRAGSVMQQVRRHKQRVSAGSVE